jgi:hypothetical protein
MENSAEPTRQRQRLKGQLEPLTVPHPTAQHLLGVGNTKYWELVKTGKVEVVAVGRSSMATYRSLKRLAGMAP